jgi:hypothetical protein
MAKIRSAEARVSKRLVLLFPGFEPLDAEAHYRRFVRGAELTAKVWGVEIGAGPLEHQDGLSRFDMTSGGTQSEFVICDLAPVMQVMAGRNFAARIARGLFAQLSFVLNGTLLAYLRTSWRYGLFFLYPLIMLAVILAISLLAAKVGGPLLGLVQFAFLLWLICKHAHFLLMMDLWHYASVLARGRTGNELTLTKQLVDASERAVRERDVAGGLDEIIVSGHSIGATLAVELADRLRASAVKTPVHVLTLGSGLLQVALHPKAARFRDMAKRRLQSGAHWLDVQALIDPINFLHSHLDKIYAIAAPNYREIIIRMRHVLSDATYRRIKFNLFRVHRQFVLPVEVKQPYSFHIIVSGPVPFADIVRAGGLPQSDMKQGHLNADAVP